MHYLTHIPENISPDTKCIIMLHGVWSNEKDLFQLKDHFWDDTIIISLRWPFDMGNQCYAWYPADFSTGKAIYKFEDVEYWYTEIVTCIDEVTEKYKLNQENIYLLGFSQWAIMGYYALWKSPERMWGIIALSGRILDEININDVNILKYARKQLFVWHGMMDQVIPFSATESVKRYIDSLEIMATLKAYPIGHTISQKELEEIYYWLNWKK